MLLKSDENISLKNDILNVNSFIFMRLGKTSLLFKVVGVSKVNTYYNEGIIIYCNHTKVNKWK